MKNHVTNFLTPFFTIIIISANAQVITSSIDKSEIENRKSYQIYAGKLQRTSLPDKDWKKIKEEDRKINPTQFGHKIKVDFSVSVR